MTIKITLRTNRDNFGDIPANVDALPRAGDFVTWRHRDAKVVGVVEGVAHEQSEDDGVFKAIVILKKP